MVEIGSDTGGRQYGIPAGEDGWRVTLSEQSSAIERIQRETITKGQQWQQANKRVL
jgi:hypothetical protein